LLYDRKFDYDCDYDDDDYDDDDYDDDESKVRMMYQII